MEKRFADGQELLKYYCLLFPPFTIVLQEKQ